MILLIASMSHRCEQQLLSIFTGSVNWQCFAYCYALWFALPCELGGQLSRYRSQDTSLEDKLILKIAFLWQVAPRALQIF